VDAILADSDLFQFVAMVLILTVVAVFSWVRKTIEKIQRQQKAQGGQPVDVGKAVREQLQKYMRAAGQLPPEAPPAAPAPPPTVPEPPRREPLVRREPTPAVIAKAPGYKFRRVMPREEVVVAVRHSRFTPRDVKKAIVQAEILGPPMAMRRDYRLF